MNDKSVLILFFSIAFLIYYYSLYFINDNTYIKIKKIHIKTIFIPETSKYGQHTKLKFLANLNNNSTCQLAILNSNIINEFITNIEKLNIKYYTIVDNQTNKCSNPQTLLNIVIEKILINFLMIFLSMGFSFLFVEIFIEINEYKKIDNIKEYNKLYNNEIV